MKTAGAQDAAEALERLGFTQYEAKVFVGLTSLGSSSVSDLYSVAGVPRSAVYGVLRSLVEKGVVEVSRGKPSMYHALPPEKVLTTLERRFDDTRKTALRSLKAVKRSSHKEKPTPEMIWFMKGHGNIEAKIAELVDGAGAFVFVGMTGVHLEPIVGMLRGAAGRGVKVLYLSTPDNLSDFTAIAEFADPVMIPKPEGFRQEPDMGFVYTDGRAALVVSFAGAQTSEMESAFYTQSEAFISFIQVALSSILGPKGSP